MKTLFLVFSLFFSLQMVAHAQSCINEHGAPPVAPLALEISDGNEYAQIINNAYASHQAVLVEFYLGGCCWYNGEVAVVNNLLDIYGSSLKVIEVEFSSDAAEVARRNGSFREGMGSPQFHLFLSGNESILVGSTTGNSLVQWIDRLTGFGNSGQFNAPVYSSSSGSVNCDTNNNGASANFGSGGTHPSDHSGHRTH